MGFKNKRKLIIYYFPLCVPLPIVVNQLLFPLCEPLTHCPDVGAVHKEQDADNGSRSVWHIGLHACMCMAVYDICLKSDS